MAVISSNFHKSSGNNKTENKKHHEDTLAFQKKFSRDVLNVTKGMVDNPFEQDALAKIDNTNVTYGDKVLTHLKNSFPIDRGNLSPFGMTVLSMHNLR